MRSVRLLFILALGLSATPGFSKLIEDMGKPARVFDESGVKVSVFPEVHPTAAGVTTPKLFLTGAGVRRKKFALFNVNIYIVSSYTDTVQKLPAEDPMSALDRNKVKALQLTFLREVSGDIVRKAFVESLKSNGADPESPALAAILNKLDMPMPKGSNLTLLGYQNGKNETLVFETPNGKTLTTEGPGVASQFWKIWFGKPADSGLENLKPELTGQKG